MPCLIPYHPRPCRLAPYLSVYLSCDEVAGEALTTMAKAVIIEPSSPLGDHHIGKVNLIEEVVLYQPTPTKRALIDCLFHPFSAGIGAVMLWEIWSGQVPCYGPTNSSPLLPSFLPLNSPSYPRGLLLHHHPQAYPMTSNNTPFPSILPIAMETDRATEDSSPPSLGSTIDRLSGRKGAASRPL